MKTRPNASKIANSKLEQDLAQRQAELAIINSVQQGLVAHLGVQAIYDLVGDEIRDIFNAQVVMISPYDPTSNTIEHRYAIERGERVYSPGQHAPGGFRSKIIRTGLPVLVNSDVAEQAARLGQPTLPGTKTPKSWLGVPMMVRGAVTGILSLQNVDEENAFEESDVRLLQTIANSMSVALENATLFDETQRLLRETEQRAVELQIINNVQEGLARRLEPKAIQSLVGEKIRETFHLQAQIVFIAMLETDTDQLDFAYLYQRDNTNPPGMDLILPLARQPLTHHQALLLENAGPLGTRGAAILVPMLTGATLQGVLGVINLELEHPFTTADLRLLETLAHATSLALENARLWEQEKIYRKALEREFEIGRNIQASFLPESLPQPPGWEIAASLKSAREVAGDFYDVFELPDGTVGLVIADVCDKGLGAALFMTLFRSLLRVISNIDFFTRGLSTPAARIHNTISLTNNYIVETHGLTGMFATIFFGILDVTSGLLTYINAGHLPPLHVNRTGMRAALQISGPAVGAMLNAQYRVGELLFEEGDTLFAYTDGLTDTSDPAGQLFEVREFVPLLAGNLPLDGLLDHFQNRIEEHASGSKQFDDITMLVIRHSKH
jgi:serine phosphatase RsbU (regulator of sigma subunit)